MVRKLCCRSWRSRSDWYEYVPDNTPATHEENAARLRQAGKCLRDIEAGDFSVMKKNRNRRQANPADEIQQRLKQEQTQLNIIRIHSRWRMSHP